MDTNKSQPTRLTQEQKRVLQRMNDFLVQFGDREQMQASYYLAKYKGQKTCEELVTPLRWDIQKEFNNVE